MKNEKLSSPKKAFQEIYYQVGNISCHSHENPPQPLLVTLKESGLFEEVKKVFDAIDILNDLLDIKIDLRDEAQSSFVSTKYSLNSISYKKAKLLKEVLD